MVNAPDFLLTSAELYELWHRMGLGRIPYPLDAQPPGSSIEERDDLRARTLADLDAKGLLRHGQPTPDVAAVLDVLGRYEVAIDAVASISKVTHRAFAASNGSRAAMATMTAGGIAVSMIEPTRLAAQIVNTVPDRGAGPGHAFALNLDTVAEAVRLMKNQPDDEEPDSPWGAQELSEAEALQRCGVSKQDAELFTELTVRTSGGQFGVMTADRPGGRPVRGQAVLNWFDTNRGRYLAVSENNWLSLAPADNARIAMRIAAALKTTLTV